MSRILMCLIHPVLMIHLMLLAVRNSRPDPVPIDDDFEKIMSDMRSMPHLKEMCR